MSWRDLDDAKLLLAFLHWLAAQDAVDFTDDTALVNLFLAKREADRARIALERAGVADTECLG